MKKNNLAVICNIPTTIAQNTDGTYSSGSWKINRKNIGQLLGNRFSIHCHKTDDSYIQGTIVGVEVDPSDIARTIIKFSPDRTSINGSTFSWGQEKAYY